MSIITITQSGNFDKTEKFLKGAKKLSYDPVLHRFGQDGVTALSLATPIDSGITASSWSYEVHGNRENFYIVWTNNNIINGFSVAIGLQYGHGTGWGGYVSGRDYINPAMRPIFDKISDDMWKEVTNL